MELFIDTNIYLNLYHFTDDDLDKLEGLLILIRDKKINLYLTTQVRHEFARNRESKIHKAITDLNIKVVDAFPRISHNYDEYREMTEGIRLFNKKRESIINNIIRDAKENKLKADVLIAELFKLAKEIDSDSFLDKAERRMKFGNPPGKNGSLGDAINWEALLENVPNDADFCIIAEDNDYSSKIDKEEISEFLKNEWGRKKKSSIALYKNLNKYFANYYPGIKLADELEKALAITAYVSSGDFSGTHQAISRLNAYTDFANDEIRKIVEASITNAQIYWIKNDTDVKKFLMRIEGLAEKGRMDIEPLHLELLRQMIYSDEPYWGLPFVR